MILIKVFLKYSILSLEQLQCTQFDWLIFCVVGWSMVDTPALVDFLCGWSIDGRYANTSRCPVIVCVFRNPCWWCWRRDRRPDWEIYICSCWTSGWCSSPVSWFASFLLHKVINWPWSWLVLYKLSWEVIKQRLFHISCPWSWFFFSKFI